MPPASRLPAASHAEDVRGRKRAEALAIGIDEDFVAHLVDTFYAKVRDDDLLGPIFAARIGRWPDHLDQMRRFWRSVLFSSGEYSGNPMIRHLAIPAIGTVEFRRWLALFDTALSEVDSEAARAEVLARARAISNDLMTGIALGTGTPFPDDERF